LIHLGILLENLQSIENATANQFVLME